MKRLLTQTELIDQVWRIGAENERLLGFGSSGGVFTFLALRRRLREYVLTKFAPLAGWRRNCGATPGAAFARGAERVAVAERGVRPAVNAWWR
jgi:hypothetical protein